MNNFTQTQPANRCGNESMAGLIATSRKCIMQKGHTGPHTDGEQQWSETLDSNYDIAAREAKDPTPAPAWNPNKCAKPECQHDCTQHVSGGMKSCCVAGCPCHAFVSSVPVKQSMQCIVIRSASGTKNVDRCILQQGHKGECDFGIGSQSGKLVPLVERKPIQIAVMGINSVFALCNDGTIWQAIGEKLWFKLAAIPQD